MPRKIHPKPKEKPDLHKVKGGGITSKMKLSSCLSIGNFDLCVSEDGNELQVWKGSTLVTRFK